MSPLLSSTAALVASALWAATPAGAGRRPGVDPSAMREAIRASQGSGENYASSAAYSHFLRSRLLHYSGEHRRSLDELRLALVTDEGNPYLLTSLAEDYARLGDLGRAELTLRKVIERAPNNHRAQLLMGRILFEGRKFARARIHLRRAIRLLPQDVEAHLALAQLELELRRSDEAIAVVEGMAKAIPDDSSGFRILGGAFGERGDAPRATRMFERAVQVFPGDYQAWAMLAQLRENAGRYEEAEAAYAEALQRDPDNVELLLSAGRASLKLGADGRAAAWFERVLSLTDEPETAVRVAFAYLSEERLEAAAQVLDRARRRSGEPRLSFYAGLMYEKLRRFSEAAAAYGDVPAKSELYAEAQVRRASALSLGGQHARALAAFRALSTARPEYLPTWTQFARALERSGAMREAERTLRGALARHPAPELYEALVTNLQRQGRPKDAVELLEQALESRPEDPTLRFLLAAALERAGELEPCLALMRGLLAESPDNAAVLNFVGYVLADHGRDFDEAERLVKRALELKPDSGAFLDSLGWVYFRRGEVARAVEKLEAAAALEPEEPVIIGHLGDAYLEANRKAEALAAYRRALHALELADEPADAQRLRAELERKVRELASESAER